MFLFWGEIMAKGNTFKGFLSDGIEVASTAAGGAIGFAAGGPIGAAVGATAPLIASKLRNMVNKKSSIEVSRYFVIETSSMYDNLKVKVEAILNDKNLKSKYGYDINNLTVDVYEFYWGDETKSFLENIDNCLSIIFKDDATDKEDEPYYSVNFLFEEEFKQINFNDMQVYSACTIHTVFGIDENRIRNYHSFSKEIEDGICKGV